MKNVLEKTKIVFEMVKIEHTVFALPFAFLGAFMAARGLPNASQTGWILLAMFGVRSAAMAFNRLVDLPFDRLNPRTESRALPLGLLSRPFVAVFVAACSGIFVLSAYMLTPLAFYLSPAALLIVFCYSYTKRFTPWSHVFLGLALACAPIGAWVAVRGELSVAALVLGLSVLLWVAGLDIIYACQDLEFDRKQPLYSVPKKFGLAAALRVSSGFHLAMVALLGWLFWNQGLGMLSFAGLVVVAGLLAYEHSLVKPTDLSRVNTAFFTLNGWISILLFLTTATDILLSRQR